MEINSLTNARVKQWAKYKEKKHREQDQKFLIEGEHLIEEAHKAGLIDVIIVEQSHTCKYHLYESYEVTPEILKKLSDSKSGTWVMAVCHYPTLSTEDLGKHIVILDDVQDPGNVGTIIRTALSFGYDSVVLSTHCADVYNEKVIRSTQGALFHLPVLRKDMEEVIQYLQEQHIPIYATALENGKPMSLVEKPSEIALVFGNEGSGVSKRILDCADQKVFIEMETFESLNVAVASGICMYHFR
ncbi:MAG: RNA methyltransferase [Longicatena sp.]